MSATVSREDASPARIWRSRATRWKFCVLAGIAVAAAAITCAWAVAELGNWLVVSAPLKHASAILVLRGGTPSRPAEAAELFRQGWAPEIWLAEPAVSAARQQMAELGIDVVDIDYDQAVLEALGVPRSAIKNLGGDTQNTTDELDVAGKQLNKIGGTVIVLVTAPYHTRRTRALWRELSAEEHEAIVRPATSDPFNAERWWAVTDDAFNVLREALGLVHLWLGAPLASRASRPVG